MKAVIKSFGCPDAEDLETWRPESNRFAIPIELLIGPDDGIGEESFDVVVCSAAWLADEARNCGIVDGRHIYIVDHWDWPGIRAYFETCVSSLPSGTWHEVATLLARMGHWEFEDYQE